MTKKIAIGVDVGGSHVSSAAFDLEAKTYLKETFAENDLDNHAQADVIIDAWGKTIRKTMELAGIDQVAGIGFAMPGPFDYEKGIPLFKGENDKYENIYGLDVPGKLREYLDLPGDFPVRFINDATAFAIGEDWVGKAAGTTRSLAITLGTGFGSAFLKESLPVVTGTEVPDQGCVWHLPFEDGIADDYFSTRGLIKRYTQLTGLTAKGAREVAEAAATSVDARAIFDDFGSKLVDLLKPWFSGFGVETLVIGGNISRAFDLFWPAMQERLREEGLKVKVETSELKETASFIGSARLIEPEFWSRVQPLLKNM
jgi:glucokinase